MKSYFDKHLFSSIRISEPPDAGVNLIVVIPCFNEPALVSTLISLLQCEPTKGRVEVIVVLNAAQNASCEALTRNKKTFHEITAWYAAAKSSFKLFVLQNENLPPKHAGVGLARKIGMDEAAWRFEASGRKEGILICLDADCTVAPNYLRAIENYFAEHPQTKAASIYFEHPLDNADEILREGIIKYELHLRYYRQALKYAGYPFHYHTIGSGMCVRSDVYQQAGGMNRRKAAEDFYFLHKIMPLGSFGEINTTTVFPEGRISERVPFGTGRAMKEWMIGVKDLKTYDVRTFEDLKIFLAQIADLFRMNGNKVEAFMRRQPAPVSGYLNSKDFQAKVAEVNAHTSSQEAFVARFFKWFDGLNVLKFVHYARDNFYPNIAVEDAAKKLQQQTANLAPLQGEELLDVYRKLEKPE